MPVDASIYGLIRQPEQRNPLQDAAQVMSLQHAMGANALNTYQLAKAQREDADANAMSDLYRGAVNPDGTVDNAKILQGAAQRGLGASIPGIQKQIADADKARADVGKVKAETGKIDYEVESKRAEHAASMLSQARDQASYDLVRQRLAQVNGPEYVRFMPAEFNPQFVQTEVARGMTVAQQLADQRAREGHAVTMRGQDLTDARTRSEGAANRSVTMRGQDLTDQRSRDQTAVQAGQKTQQGVIELRKEFNALPEVKNFKEVLPVIQSASRAPNTPAGDIDLIYGVGKVMDPNSVVREGEMSLVIKAGSPAQRLQGYVNYVQGGGRLSAAQRQELMTVMQSRVQGLKSNYDAALKTYGTAADKQGLPRDQIFIDSPEVPSTPTDLGALPTAKPGRRDKPPQAPRVVNFGDLK